MKKFILSVSIMLAGMLMAGSAMCADTFTNDDLMKYGFDPNASKKVENTPEPVKVEQDPMLVLDDEIIIQVKKFCNKYRHDSYQKYETCIKRELRHFKGLLDKYVEIDGRIARNCSRMYHNNYRYIKICIEKELKSQDRIKKDY